MNIRLFFILIIFGIGLSCSDDDENVGIPTLLVTGEDVVKPDSALLLEIAVNVPGLLRQDGIQGEVLNGEGALARTTIQGENSSNGSASFEFTAGSSEDTNSLLRFTATDQAGQMGTLEFEVDITSLDIKQVVVLNEGNFFSANGTLDVVDVKSGEVEPGVYQVSATVQQAVPYLDNIYLVTNAPDRLDVLDNALSLQVSVSEGLDNPVDFAAVGDVGYVSNWGDINTAFTDEPDSYIALVDLTNNTLFDSVTLTARPQGLLAHQDLIYIANEGGASVSVLDPNDLSLAEIPTAAGPSELISDGNGLIWVLCTSGSLMAIDPSSSTVVTEIANLITSGFNEKMAMNGTGEILYFLGGSNDSFTGLTTVYKVDINTEDVTPIIENGFALYGIGVNPESGEIYLGDSNAFQSTGTGFRYDILGNEVDQFATGIGPKSFLFL